MHFASSPVIPKVLCPLFFLRYPPPSSFFSAEELPDSIHLFNKPTVGGLLLGVAPPLVLRTAYYIRACIDDSATRSAWCFH